MSECFGSTPCFACGSQAGPARRPRYYWLDWNFSNECIKHVTGSDDDWSKVTHLDPGMPASVCMWDES
eukprot:9552574-Karenia_brevis.AAC.1